MLAWYIDLMTTGKKVAIFLIALMLIAFLFWISVILYFNWEAAHVPDT